MTLLVLTAISWIERRLPNDSKSRKAH